MAKFSILFLMCCSVGITQAQERMISGTVMDRETDERLAHCTVLLPHTSTGTSTDSRGNFKLLIPAGTNGALLVVSRLNYQPDSIELNSKQSVYQVHLNSSNAALGEVVITGTRTPQRQTSSPVLVNVINSKMLGNLQACNLSEGLKFQPGLRTETDCQTCNYSQLRMNGLAGGYSQILINGRPIFSPLMGLYGMEQLPVNMIDRIEVIRGGGSSLYGSSAIGGTVNVITKLPTTNSYEVNSSFQQIDGSTNDVMLNGNISRVNKKKDAGMSLFVSHRKRGLYDANGDNFSEAPELNNISAGANFFYKPAKNQKLELSISRLYEYRFGGEMVDKPAFLNQQCEERTQRVLMGNVDYQLNLNSNSSLIVYAAAQYTSRSHYTGTLPDDSVALEQHLLNPPYGNSVTSTLQGGFQLNHRLDRFLGGSNTLTVGAEFISDKTLDEIPAYRYKVDQHTKDLGIILQSDWKILANLNLLAGTRIDRHNLIDNIVASPRVALMYKIKELYQLRASYGTGFRAPQAFDTDLHIAFAGGGVSRVQLSPGLQEERSESYSLSLNYDKATEDIIYGYTLEAFDTRLKDAFILANIGQDSFGQIFEKQNGQAARVRGFTVELRTNYKKRIQLESGFTIQTSRYASPVKYVNGIDGTRQFLRTPNQYGYASLTASAGKRINASLGYVYTGKMKVAHFAGAPNQLNDEIITSPSFSELNIRAGYTIPLPKLRNSIEIYTGVKNIFNAYQSDFDMGKYRDSNYIYGPALPRSYFVGIKIKG